MLLRIIKSSELNMKEVVIICIALLVVFMVYQDENSKTNQCRKILNESAYHLTHLQVEYYEKNCKSN
jgi:hypothetical protein